MRAIGISSHLENSSQFNSCAKAIFFPKRLRIRPSLRNTWVRKKKREYEREGKV
jgi:hypothetical protein